MSFIYDVIDVFCIPYKQTKELFDTNRVLKVCVYLQPIDTDSTSLQFFFISDENRLINEDEASFDF